MAYRTKRSSYARRRYPARKSGGRAPRRSYAKKRTYRKKASRPMSRRNILNVSSRKKRDTMLPVSQIGSSGTPSQGGYNVGNNPGNGGATTILPWIATCRDNSINTTSGEIGTIFEQSTRTATSCYMRGLREDIEIQTSSSIPWQWRRVCFTTKDPAATIGTGLGGISGVYENSNGFQRHLYNVTSGTTPDAMALGLLRGAMFKGQLNIDWLDYMTAPIDTQRVTLRYDKTRTIASGNQSGCIRKYKMWHGMNKTLVYDDDENGAVENASYYSVSSKAGMGDYYVVDIFTPGKGATASDALSFEPQATLYWHER